MCGRVVCRDIFSVTSASALEVRMPRDIKVVSETVAAPAHAVYEFARRREHLHRWASGLASADIEEEGDHWVLADSPMGRIEPGRLG